ncbi:MAG: CRTAC1 family protein [Bacteroidota bacterium]
MNKFLSYFSFSLIIILSTSWSNPAQDNHPVFVDKTKEAGIDFMYTFGDYTYENILESSGSGITVFDYNNDGWFDIYMLNGTYMEGISDKEGEIFRNTHNKLYKNNGDGTFTEVSEKAGVDDRHWSMAAGVIDIDNDGDEDIYLLNYGPNVFYRNNGNGTFTEITEQLKLRGPKMLNGFKKWSVGVAFWDYNTDGLLDAMVGNFLAFDPEYVSPTMPDMMPHPSEYKGQASIMYEQQPDGTFKDVTKEIGFYYPDSKCMGLTVYDYDDDGDLDMFQGNDHQLNFMFRNDDGKFKEVAIASGIATNSKGLPTGSMHGSIGDIDGDGIIDILVTDLRYGAMYKNMGNGIHKDITESCGIAAAFDGKGEWGAALFDYDNDADLDIMSANGNGEALVLQPPLFLENNGKGQFKNVGKERCDYFKTKRSGRAVATLDYDNDGDLDVIFSHIDLKASAILLENQTNNGNHWLGITLLGKDGPRNALSAKVIAYTKDKKQVFINQRANSYLSYNDPRLHIGLGKTTEIEKLEITWNDGEKEEYIAPGVDRYLTIKQGQGIIKK